MCSEPLQVLFHTLRPRALSHCHITQVTRIWRVRLAFEVQNPPTRQSSIKLASVSNWSIARLHSCTAVLHHKKRRKAAINLVRVVPAAVLSKKKGGGGKEKEAESDHVTVSCARSLEFNFFFPLSFSVVLMDMPKVASMIGLLSSDEISDSNEAMPVRKKQIVR